MSEIFDLSGLNNNISQIIQQAGPTIAFLAVLFVILIVVLIGGYLYIMQGYGRKFPNVAIVFDMVGGQPIGRLDYIRKVKDAQGHEQYQLKSSKEFIQKFSYQDMVAWEGGKKAVFIAKASDEEHYPARVRVFKEADGTIVDIKPLLTGSDRNAYIDGLYRNFDRSKNTNETMKAIIMSMVIFGVFMLLVIGVIVWRTDQMATALMATRDTTANLIALEKMRFAVNSTIIG